jgi:hypothetical protein
MGTYWPPITEHEAVVASSLRVITADHYNRASNPYADAESEHAAEQLALAARDLTRAVNAKPADIQPIGWTKTAEQTDSVRHVYLDTEFMRDDLTYRGLVSIALTDDDGNDYYAVNHNMGDVAVRDDDWMRENVWPYLPRTVTNYKIRGEIEHLDRNHPDVRFYGEIADQVAAYFTDTKATTTYLYARNGAQDVVRLHGLWDHDWGVMPKTIPRWFIDIHALIEQAGNPDGIPEMESGAHHPLEDARHNRTVRHFLEAL